MKNWCLIYALICSLGPRTCTSIKFHGFQLFKQFLLDYIFFSIIFFVAILPEIETLMNPGYLEQTSSSSDFVTLNMRSVKIHLVG